MAKSRPPDHPPVVYVEWHDSRSLTSAWTDREAQLAETEQLYNEVIVSAGLLLEVRKKYVVIALGLAPVDDIMHALIIPRSEIRKLVVLKKARGMKLVKKRQARA